MVVSLGANAFKMIHMYQYSVLTRSMTGAGSHVIVLDSNGYLLSFASINVPTIFGLVLDSYNNMYGYFSITGNLQSESVSVTCPWTGSGGSSCYILAQFHWSGKFAGGIWAGNFTTVTTAIGQDQSLFAYPTNALGDIVLFSGQFSGYLQVSSVSQLFASQGFDDGFFGSTNYSCAGKQCCYY